MTISESERVGPTRRGAWLALALALAIGCTTATPDASPKDVALDGSLLDTSLSDVSSPDGAASLDAPSSGAPPPSDAGAEGSAGGPTVTIDDGTLQGKVVGNTFEFLGIPYAAPPLGDLRFAPPQLAAPWTGVRSTTDFGPLCPQLGTGGSFQDVFPHSEDCLSLNVYAPAKAPVLPAPVMVFVHGGSFVTGGGAEYDGRLLSEATGVVVVTINYRLGALGFLLDPSIDKAIGVPSGNMGIRDQLAALSWVQRNIAVFGGDPGNVTAFGQSAGASSVCTQIFATGSDKLVHRFVMESGGCVQDPVITMVRSDVAYISNQFVQDFCAHAPDTLVCLRQLPADAFVTWTSDSGTAASADAGPTGPNPLGEGWRPQVDGVLVKDYPHNLLASGAFNHAPLIIGTNPGESLIAQSQTNVGSVLAFDIGTVVLYPNEWATLLPIYAPATDAQANAHFLEMMTDTWFRCPARALARGAAAAGVPVYLYSFELPPGVHEEELDYVYGYPLVAPLLTSPPYTVAAPNPPVASLVRAIQSYWTQFAKTGDPNTASVPDWPPYATDTDQNITFDSTIRVATGLVKTQCDAWSQAFPGP